MSMVDVFFSYSSKDRPRVQPVRDALVNRGFAVFWDQEIPASTDWDTWIRQRLHESKCAVVVWSFNSVTSDNVRHEAFIAKQQNKIVPILLDSLSADLFPMGFYAVQAANLTGWSGALEDSEWLKLLNEIESKLTPSWMKRTLDTLDAELVGERARRETAERRDRTLRERIAKEAEARQQLRVELDDALQRGEELDGLLKTEREQRQLAEARSIELVTEISARDVRQQSIEKDLGEARRVIETLQQQITAVPKSQKAQVLSPTKSAVQDVPVDLGKTASRTEPLLASQQSDAVFEERWKEWETRPKSTPWPLYFLGVAAVVLILVMMMSR